MKYIITAILILCCCQLAVVQNCDGPLAIELQGSMTATPIAAEADANNINCQSTSNGSIELMVEGGNGNYEYVWSDNAAAEGIRENLEAGNYEVTITDGEGCEIIVSSAIVLMNAENSNLAMEAGCGNCVLGDGNTDYFFNANNDYIAAIVDPSGDNVSLGDTEVCLQMETGPGDCDAHPYLQRSWSVKPTTEESACLKLFFTQTEFEALTNELPDVPVPTPENLVNNDALCITGFSGGLENCDDFTSAKVYAQTDATPLSIILEDTLQGIWSAEICTDEYATFFFHVCALPLPLQLLNFYGNPTSDKNVLFWNTAEEINLSSFEIQFSSDGSEWRALKKVPATNGLNNSYICEHKNPPKGITYYRLNIYEINGQSTFSDIIALRQTGDNKEQFQPILFSTYTDFQIYLNNQELYDFIFYDAAGLIVYREKVLLNKGLNKYRFNLSRLASGTYFCQIFAEQAKIITRHKIIKAE